MYDVDPAPSSCEVKNEWNYTLSNSGMEVKPHGRVKYHVVYPPARPDLRIRIRHCYIHALPMGLHKVDRDTFTFTSVRTKFIR
jgi:hypothetical protein